ncbi:MAG: slipin family protein [Thermomicrobiales bacterium]|nr:slipin family protein [Thermomicrobiales bacterium]
MAWILAGVIIVFVLLVLISSIKVVQEYERGVVFRLGRLAGVRGPGLILLVPFIERMQKIDLRTVTMDIPAQEVITRDNVTVRVNAVAYFRVIDPSAAVVNVADYIRATSQIAQTTLRSVLGQSSLDDLLSQREKINQELQQIIDEQTEPWGVKVSVVEVKDVELPQSMQRAMARQAEAERDKRAKIIHAEGEFQAAEQLGRAADIINQNPVTIQLRYLQTLTEIGTEKNTTIAFPIPIDMFGAFMGSKSSGGGNSPAPFDKLAKVDDEPVAEPEPEVNGDGPAVEREFPRPRPDMKGVPAPKSDPGSQNA